MLFVRGVGPIGYPGGAEVVNMQPPAALIKKASHHCPASAMDGNRAHRDRHRS
jgi:dihydroxyacid dehydratase/phosphogluconate dehydratase